jgi:hypothetical protein
LLAVRCQLLAVRCQLLAVSGKKQSILPLAYNYPFPKKK